MLLLVAFLLGWLALRVRVARRYVWTWSKPPVVGAGRLRRVGEWVRRAAIAPTAWWTRSSLRIDEFKATPGSEEGTAAAKALVAALGRVGSTSRSGVDVVAAPVRADTAVSEVKDALKGMPQTKALAALLALARWIKPRDDLTLSGHVVTSDLVRMDAEAGWPSAFASVAG